MDAIQTNMASKMVAGGKSNMATVDTKMAANMANINVNKMASKMAAKNGDFTFYHSLFPFEQKSGEIEFFSRNWVMVDLRRGVTSMDPISHVL